MRSSQRFRRPGLCCNASNREVSVSDLKPFHNTRGKIGSRVTLFYSSAWPEVYCHYAIAGSSSWKDVQLACVGSSGGRWKSACVDVGNSSRKPLLQFVMTDGKGQYDKAVQDRNYQVDRPGAYTLEHGMLQKQTVGDPILLVSDLDGTMVGDDEGTTAFRDLWQMKGVLQGSVLVYSTGRTLPQFQQLLAEKDGVLLCPDVLISAVGTKIYLLNMEGRWVEDMRWTHFLDAGWNVAAVREAAYSLLAKLGQENAHFRPPVELNEHKITMGVRSSVVKEAVQLVQKGIEDEGVQANVVVSGEGDWKYLDVLPTGAGKLASLEYVRRELGFSVESTVACGDSGNDISMLSGEVKGIIVANAQDDLLHWYDSIHDSEQKQRVYRTSASMAHGIIDGLAFFGLM